MKINTAKCNAAYDRVNADVAAFLSAFRLPVTAAPIAQVPGESSALRTGAMTTARSGSNSWIPPS